MSTPISPPSPTRTLEEIELPSMISMPAPAVIHSATTENSSSDPSTGSNSQRGSTTNVAGTSERRGGGMSSHSASASAGGTGTGTGIKTPRKNVQWAASTKGEGPMGAAEHPPPHPHPVSHYHRAGLSHPQPHQQHEHAPSESEIRHMHLLDKEGLDVSTILYFQDPFPFFLVFSLVSCFCGRCWGLDGDRALCIASLVMIGGRLHARKDVRRINSLELPTRRQLAPL